MQARERSELSSLRVGSFQLATMLYNARTITVLHPLEAAHQ